jgi:hypothetical protein
MPRGLDDHSDGVRGDGSRQGISRHVRTYKCV